MLKFLEGLINNADDIAYGAGTELYDRMVSDTQDRHTKFTKWGSQLQTDLNERKKSLQLQQGNYNEAINSLKNLPPDELNKELLLKNIDIDTYLAPLASQLGTGMFLGDRNEILNRIMHFLKEAPIKTGTPFVPSENYFEQNFDKLDNQIQSVSGMGYNTWRTLTNRGELSMVDDASRVKFKEEDRLRSDLEVSSMSAKALGILNTYPGTIEGNQNLQFQQVSLIVANARAQFPDDLETREDFIAKKLPENGINPMDALLYHNSVQFKQISKVIDQYGSRTANEMAEIINQLKNPQLSTEAVQRLNEQLSQLTLSQHELLNKYSLQIPGILAGEDVDLGIGTDTTKEEVVVPQVAKNYLPRLDNKGELTIEYDNGETQNLSLEMLINNPDNLKGIPTVAQEYILKIQDSLFEDGKMVEPTREMFKKGNAGDKAFKDFLEIYFGFNPEIGLTGQTGKGGVGLHYTFSNWFKNVYEGTKRIADPGDGTRRGPGELRVKQYADINQFVTNEVASSLTTGALPVKIDKVTTEELKSETLPILDENKQPIVEDQTGSQFKTRVSGQNAKNLNSIKTILEDSNIKTDKQESLLKKIQKEFGTLSVGMSGGGGVLPAIVEDNKELSTSTQEVITNYPQKVIDEIYKNSNPGMIKYFVGSGWKGETFEGKPGEDGKRIVYRKYPTSSAGLLDILNIIKGYNLTDIDDIMNKYATDDGSGKVIEDYGGLLQNRGVPKKINILNRDHLEALLKGIVHAENSIQTYKGKSYEKSYTQKYKQKDYDSAINKFLSLLTKPN